MSASREKKIRQQAGQELTEKQLNARRKAAAAKRNSIIYTVLGAACAVLVVALLVWNSGLFQSRVKVLTIGDQTYRAADVQYYYRQIYSQYYIQASYGIDIGLDLSTPLDEQMYDEENNITWHDYLLDEAVKAVTEIKAVNDAAKEEGYTLSAEGKQTVSNSLKSLSTTSANSGYTSVASYLKAMYGKGMSKGRMKDILTWNVLAQEFESKYTDSLSYTDKEIEDYYTEHADELDQFKYDYFFVDGAPDVKTDSAGNTVVLTDKEIEKALADAKAIADEIAGKLRKGDKAEELSEEYKENEKVSARADQENSGSGLTASYGDWLKEAGRTDGEVAVLETATKDGYYVIRFLSRGRDQEIPGDVRHILVAAEQDEGATEPTQAQYDAAKATAEQMLKDWKAAGGTEEAFIELAQKESADPGSASNGGLYEQVYSGSNFIEEFSNWATDPARRPGDTGLVQNTESTTKGWHIMYYVKGNDPVWKQVAKNAMLAQDVQEWIDSLTDVLEVTRLDGLKNVG